MFLPIFAILRLLRRFSRIESRFVEFRSEVKKMRQSKKAWIRKIDFVFYNEAEIRLLVKEARSKLEEHAIKRSGGTADPTAREAISNLTPVKSITLKGKELSRPEDWLQVIDNSYDWARKQGNPRYIIAKLKYIGEDYRLISMKCHVSIRFQYALIENFRRYATSKARDLEYVFIVKK